MQEYKFHNKLSFRNKYWEVLSPDLKYVIAAHQKFGISNFIATLLYNKKIPLENIPDFLNPKIKNYLPDPSKFLGMELATDRIFKAISGRQNIVVFGDYDVDGGSASAMLKRYFNQLNLPIKIYIPDRIKEGYGLNTKALLDFKNEGADLVITVDCGVTSFEPILEAKKAGLETIVIDHHLSTETLPQAVAVVNPNRFDEKTEHTNLCAAGVVFLLLVALNKKLRTEKYFETNNLPEPDLLSLLDIVALATVCDVMTLTGLNRAFVSQGLKQLASRKNIGLKALADVSGLTTTPDVYSLGFLLGPRINAGGRIGDCGLGARLLSSDDEAEALNIAKILNDLNKERQEIEKLALDEAMKMAEEQNAKNKPFLMLANENWHPGIIGIIAGRIKEVFNKPTAIISINNGVGKASARSVSGVDIGRAIVNAKNCELLIAGGGHKAAAGFTIASEKLEAFFNFINSEIEKDYENYKLNNKTYADFCFSSSAITKELANEINYLAPFGNGNSEPTIIIENAKIVNIKTYAEKHTGFFIADGDLLKPSSNTLKCVTFNSVKSGMADVINANYMKSVSLLGKIRKNFWNGEEKIEFSVDDII